MGKVVEIVSFRGHKIWIGRDEFHTLSLHNPKTVNKVKDHNGTNLKRKNKRKLMQLRTPIITEPRKEKP